MSSREGERKKECRKRKKYGILRPLYLSRMKRNRWVFFLLVFFLFPSILKADMTGGDYEIYADVFSSLDNPASGQGDFTLYGTMGDIAAEDTSGGVLSLRGGFQAMERSSLSLSVSPTTLNLGNLSQTSIKSASSVLTVSTDSQTGYSVIATEDGNLRTGSGADIDDVTDGSVSSLSEEYGARTTGNAGQLLNDTAIQGNLLVATSSTIVETEQTTITFRASISNSSAGGSYSHIVTFTASANP